MFTYERYHASCVNQGKTPMSRADFEKARAETIQRANENTRREREACLANNNLAGIYGGDCA